LDDAAQAGALERSVRPEKASNVAAALLGFGEQFKGMLFAAEICGSVLFAVALETG
jgi:hypothetical protein